MMQSTSLANAELPVGSLDIPLDFHIAVEPVVTSSYVARLQSAEVDVKSGDRLIKLADTAADILGTIKKQVQRKLDDFSYDLRPLLDEVHGRISEPVNLPLGETSGCARLKVLR